ncbi:diacylglycerol kinase [Terasakiella brassicae]|uniref:Diacylglycerol kinase n=1 Tax=Terasakiella brassicae TaxID=1634917 RepID=A0A917FDE1_9PROT|nr:cytochrome c [Terasakiella brassicae]GGF68581.1 diacylglycerol kinase [Terasakiella brassicae]
MSKHSYASGFLALALMSSSSAIANNNDEDAIKRGKYVMDIGGCVSCHTDKKNKGQHLAGGVALPTPFGTFYTPNITSDEKYGIGAWTTEQFIEAMTQGVAPDGSHYFPAFPYTSYAKMKRQDLIDLKAYLNTVEAVAEPTPDHDVPFPFNIREGMIVWKELFFDDSPFSPDPSKSTMWNRGAYLVNGPSHCVECHTSRNFLGGLDRDNLLAGEPKSPEGEKIPSLLISDGSEFSNWSHADTIFSLQMGMTPKGDFLGGSMGKVVTNTTGKMTEEDLQAIATYLGKPVKKKSAGKRD